MRIRDGWGKWFEVDPEEFVHCSDDSWSFSFQGCETFMQERYGLGSRCTDPVCSDRVYRTRDFARFRTVKAKPETISLDEWKDQVSAPRDCMRYMVRNGWCDMDCIPDTWQHMYDANRVLAYYYLMMRFDLPKKVAEKVAFNVVREGEAMDLSRATMQGKASLNWSTVDFVMGEYAERYRPEEDVDEMEPSMV